MQEGQQLYSSYIANCILNALLCFTAIMFNIVTIQAIQKTSSLSRTLKTMLLNLAVSDLAVGLIVQPLYIAHCVLGFKQVSNNDLTYNNTFILSGYLFAAVSFLNVMVLITDRFLVIHLHLRYQELVTQKRVAAVVILIWVVSAIFSVSRLLIPKNIFYAGVSIIMLACVITLTFLSFKIYLNVRSQINQIHALGVNLVPENGELANILRLRKFAIAAVHVYIVFVVCYLPYVCDRFAAPFIAGSSVNMKRLQLYSETLVYLNSSLNPLVYCWKMKHIRHTVMDVLRNVFKKKSDVK